MTRIRHGERIWEIHDEEWPRWVRLGWIPPEAMVLSARWTKGVWRQADSLEVYHLFRPTPKAAPPLPPADPGVRRHGPFGIFRGPGPSITELLILANVLVGLVLYMRWGEEYSTHLWAYSTRLMETLEAGGIQVLFIPLFLHADFAHLSGNMLTFVLAGAVIEEFYGRARMFAIYIGAGLSGALFSLLREKDVLSVGASGAILGMYGAGLVFLLRESRHFNDSQRYRLKRVQIPFFLLMVVPAILHADFYAHLGGFLGGMALGLLLPPLADRLPRPGHLTATVEEAPARTTPGDLVDTTRSGEDVAAHGDREARRVTISGPGNVGATPIAPFPVRPPSPRTPDEVGMRPRIIPFPQNPKPDPPVTPGQGDDADRPVARPDDGSAPGRGHQPE